MIQHLLLPLSISPSFRMENIKKLCVRVCVCVGGKLQWSFYQDNLLISTLLSDIKLFYTEYVCYFLASTEKFPSRKKASFCPGISNSFSSRPALSVRSVDWWKYLINVKCLNVNTFNRKFLIFQLSSEKYLWIWGSEVWSGVSTEGKYKVKESRAKIKRIINKIDALMSKP